MKSKMSYTETKQLLDDLLSAPSEQAREEAQFHDALEEHVKPMYLSSNQWLRIFQTYTGTVFRRRFEPSKLLSEIHLKQLMDQIKSI